MCQSLIKLSELYQAFPGVLFLHGITKTGGESDVPLKSTFADQITNAILDSNNTKLSTHSFALRVNERHHLWSPYGIILREGDVIAADPEDTGLRKDALDQVANRPRPDFQIVLNPDRDGYNELLVQHAIVIGIFIWWQLDGQFSPMDIHSASSNLGLPVHWLNEQGLFRAEWNTDTGAFDIPPGDPLDLEELFV